MEKLYLAGQRVCVYLVAGLYFLQALEIVQMLLKYDFDLQHLKFWLGV